MRKLEYYWQSNHAWWKFQDGIPVLTDDAPPEAKKSFERYLRQIEEYERENERRRKLEEAGLDWVNFQ